MKIKYNNKTYELVELMELGGGSTYGMIGIFELQYVYYKNDERWFASEEDYLAQEENNYDSIIREEWVFINYFFKGLDDRPSIVEDAKYFIDNDLKNNPLKCLVKKLKDAYSKCEENYFQEQDVDALEYAQNDLLYYIVKGKKIKEDEPNCWSKEELIKEMKESGIDLDSQAEIREFLLKEKGLPTHTQIEIVKEMGFTPFEDEEWR